MKTVNCQKCGCECYWDTNRNGKRYLAQRNVREYEGGTGTWKSPHYCSATPEQAAEYQACLKREAESESYRDAQRIVDGEIVVGQTVKVYRGRKVPQGTVGVVFWVAEEANQFDVWKIGIKTEDGTKHFLAINHVDYFWAGADALNESRVAQAKQQAKTQRAKIKASVASGEEVEI